MMRISQFAILIVFLLFSTLLRAEGTKQLAPNSTDRIYLYANAQGYNNFCRYDGEDDQRLYIHIENPETEQLFLGFSQAVSSAHYPCNNSVGITSYFRIKDPTGRVVFPVKDNPSGQLLNNTTANIGSYNQAVAGPAPIVGATGYNPFVFDPTGLPSGDYYIEFSQDNDSVRLNAPIPIEWFDITVATKSLNPSAIQGRVFSRNWALFAPSISCGTDVNYAWFDRPFNGRFFVYTDKDIVSEVDFQGAGFQPAAFNVVFNDIGTSRTNNVIEDRKSLDNVRASTAQHRIFLNDPDINVYLSGVLGGFTVPPKLIACENGTACVEARMTQAGQIDVLIDLDRTSGEFVYDIGSADRLIAFKVEPEPGEEPPYIRCIPWDGKDGFGNKLPGEVALESAALLTRYTQGIYHFPIYDAEYMLNGFDVTTIRPVPDNGSPKKIYYDDSNILDNYGVGIVQPKQDPFNGCGVPCHLWSNKDFGNLNTINTWFFAREEHITQLEEGDCPINAHDDSSHTIINVPLDIDVLVNDLGTINIDTTSITVGYQPSNGTARFDTTLLEAHYFPNPGFIGRDTFTYVFCYGILPVKSLCDSATVYVVVDPKPENCNNAFDDDGDGFIDCDDPDCQPLTPTPIVRKKQGNFWWLVFFFFIGGLRINRRSVIFQ